MISSFASCLQVDPPVILGRRLQPFSAWHQLSLEAFENPFANVCEPDSMERLPDAADTVEAFLLCCDRYSHDKRTFHRFCESPWFRFRLRCRLAFTPWPIVADQLRAYIRSYSFAPRISAGKGTKLSKVPVAFHMAAVMLSHGLPFQEALEMPLCTLVCLKLAIAEQDGLDIIESDIIAAIDCINHPDRQRRSFLADFFGSQPSPASESPLTTHHSPLDHSP